VGLTGARPVSMTGLKYLRHFQRSSFTVAMQAPLSANVSREMENLMQHYMTYILERGLNTPAFLRRVRKDAQAQADFDGE